MNTKYVALVLLAAGGAAASAAPAYYVPGPSTNSPPAVITGDDYLLRGTPDDGIRGGLNDGMAAMP